LVEGLSVAVFIVEWLMLIVQLIHSQFIDFPTEKSFSKIQSLTFGFSEPVTNNQQRNADIQTRRFEKTDIAHQWVHETSG
jgi:hypothetical protein